MHLFPKYLQRETILRRRRDFYRPRIMARESLLARSLIVSQEGRIQERRRPSATTNRRLRVILGHPSFPRLAPSRPVCPLLLPDLHIRRESGYRRTWRSTPGKNTLAPSRKLLFRTSLATSELFLVCERTYRVCRRDDKRQIPTAGDELPKRREGRVRTTRAT